MTMLLAVIVLLALARIRFPQRPATPNLVPPLLAQLARSSPFDDLSDAVSALEAEVAPALQVVSVHEPSGASRTIPALRFRDDAAIALVAETEAAGLAGGSIARDRVTGLTVMRTSASSPSPRRIWTPQREGFSRYLLFTDAATAGTSLRPMFVGSLANIPSARWQTPVWLLPRQVRVPEGSFVFTTAGALAGLVVEEPEGQAIVPADAVVAAAERLLRTEQAPAGSLGITVQDITPPLRKATQIASGVIVAHVDEDGPAAGQLVPTDVIDRMNDQPIGNRSAWDAHAGRLSAGQRVSLRVRRNGQIVDIQLIAAAAAPAQPPALGLTMRSRPRLGTEITRVDAGSIAERAGIETGDVLVRAGNLSLPTPTQVNASFAALPSGGAMLVAVARGDRHFVVALAKP